MGKVRAEGPGPRAAVVNGQTSVVSGQKSNAFGADKIENLKLKVEN